MFGGKHNCVAVIVIVHPQPRGRLNPYSSGGLKQLGGVSGMLNLSGVLLPLVVGRPPSPLALSLGGMERWGLLTSR